MRWFFLFGLSFRLFAGSFEDVTPSSPDEILSLTSDLLVEGFVSVTSGQISLSETDLHVKGAQDLVLKRTYVPPQILGRYADKDKSDRFALGKALCQLESKGWIVLPHLLAGYNQNSFYFQVRDPQGFVLEFEIVGDKGILRTASHGCSNLRSERPSSEADIRNIEFLVEEDQVRVTWPEGTQRIYAKLSFRSYRLDREILPNGKVIRYEYNREGLVKILSSDPTGKHTYATITKVGPDHYLGSDGNEAQFVYETREIKGEFKKGNDRQRTCVRFPVMKKASNALYQNTVGYNNRTLLNSYDARAYPISCNYFQIKNTPSRIQTFSTPSGSTSFSYDPPIAGQKKGGTAVMYPDGALIVYRFNKILLLEAIENWFEEKLINKKTFSYDSKQHIQKIETLDGAGNLLLAKQFECDSAGNPLLERTEGDFGIFSIRRKFDKNRLIFEDRDDGLQYEFTYKEGTRLVTSKTTLEFGKQLRKTTFHYDDAYNLIEELEENKTKKHYTLYQTAPHLHRVEWEEKTDWEDELIYKIHYRYDQWGNTAEEQHFGSDGMLAYTIKRTFNNRGELLEETNPLGQTALYKYDERGRCFYEEPFSNGLIVTRTFDKKGRLKVLNESGHETQVEYNASDELIEKTDYLDYTKKIHYDPVHGKPDRIEEPQSITKIVYDAFGREKERIDPYDAKTKKHYNSYGDVTKIIYPDEGEETFSYFPNGLLKSHTDPDGLITTYLYDSLGRLKEKTVGNYTTVFHYDGYNLYEMIDAAGFITKYKYDLSGRKIEEDQQNRISSFGYDPLGFLAWEERGKRRIEYTNDFLGQVLKKSIDHVLETSWTYDAGGNVATIEQGGITTFKYDPYNRLIETIDPEKYKTTVFYEKGSQVLLKKTTDPMEIETIETYNPRGQLLKKEVAGQTVEEMTYDKAFRLEKQDHLTFGYTLNGKQSWIKEAEKRTTKWTYTPGDRILTKEKPDGTILICEYDTQWRSSKVGTREFRYDELDRIIGGAHFSRKLDAFGNIKREEWSNGLWIESDYDDWDRPLERRLPDQSRIQYDYEGPFLKTVTRFSPTGIEMYSHVYDQHDARGNPQSEKGLFETIYRHDKQGRKISQQNPYFQETITYNPAGNLVRKGNITYTYDDLSQMTSELGRFTAKYDAHYNLKELNGNVITVNPLHEIEGLAYDLNGNLLKPGFIYDEFDQLIEVGEESFIYDALGRRIQKGNTSFLYIHDEEIGAFEQGKPKELKVLGRTPIAIEIEGKPYAAIADVQGTLRLAIDYTNPENTKQNICDTFGVGLTDEIPYAWGVTDPLQSA